MDRRRLVRGAAIVAALMVTVVLSVPPVRAVVLDVLDASPAPTGTPSPTPTESPSPSSSPTAHDPVIAAAGDISCAPLTPTASECHQQATSDLLASAGLDGVLDLGDNQYEVGALTEYNAYYGPTWGRVKPLTHPVPGNHDYDTPGASGYFSYFGSAAGDPAKGYYSFNIGAWHVVALNSNCSSVGGCGAGSPQERWLRADLAANASAACTLAYWHHPRFSSGTTHGSSTASSALWQALDDSGAEVVLVGHEHNYERFAPQTADGTAVTNGVREFVVGTGGKSHNPFGTPIANSQARNSVTFGVLKLTLHPTSYAWQFVPEAGASFTDSGWTACH
jgi:hypothetical protein